MKHLEDIEAPRYAVFSSLLSLYPCHSRSGPHFAVQQWITLWLWQQKCLHLVITIWCCGRQPRHTSCCYGDWDHAVRFIHIHWTVPWKARRNRALAYELCGAAREVALMHFCVQWVRRDERNLGGPYRCVLVAILRAAASFCGYLTLWPWSWTFTVQHTIYVNCEYFVDQEG